MTVAVIILRVVTVFLLGTVVIDRFILKGYISNTLKGYKKNKK